MCQATSQFHHGSADLITKRGMALMVMHRRCVVASTEEATTRAARCGGARCGCADGGAVMARSPEVDASAAGSDSGVVGCVNGHSVAAAEMHLCFYVRVCDVVCVKCCLEEIVFVYVMEAFAYGLLI